MPYKRSTARLQFDASLEMLKDTVILAEVTPGVPSPVFDSVLGFSIVNAWGLFEVYQEDLIKGWAVKVQSAGVTFDKLPANLRDFILSSKELRRTIFQFGASQDESAHLSKVVEILGRGDFAAASQSAVFGLDMSDVLECKYPSPKNIRKLYNRLGVPRVMVELNARARSNIEGDLTAINDIRSEIVHECLSPALSAGDIILYLNKLKNAVSHLDRLLCNRFSGFTGYGTWPA